jgi:integrase
MSQIVYDSLTEQQKATGNMKYVFCNRKGDPLDNKNFISRIWNPLLRYLGLKIRRPYQCRHTAATLWLASGEAPESRQLGHSTTEMLFSVYSRYVPNLTRKAGVARSNRAGRAKPTNCNAYQGALDEIPVPKVYCLYNRQCLWC